MFKILANILLVLLIPSCNQLTERHYKNSDSTSGGFLDVKLDLNPDRTLTLTRIDQRVADESEVGISYKPETFTSSGTWTNSNFKLHFNFNESAEFVTEAFFKSGFNAKGIYQNQNQIIISTSIDTIYIYGQPCVKVK